MVSNPGGRRMRASAPFCETRHSGFRRVRRARPRRAAMCVAAAVLVCLAASSAPAEESGKKPAEKEDPTKPWLKAGGITVFRFAADALPDTGEDFAAALTKGLARQVKV